MRLLICAGGTGGGVYPALAVLQALQHGDDLGQPEGFDMEVLWVGSEGGLEEDLVKREQIAFRSIPAAGVHGVDMRTLPRNLARLAQGVGESRRILHDFQPDVILFTGGYVAVPMAFAVRIGLGQSYNTQSLVYIPDIEPGWALKSLLRMVDHAALTVEESQEFLPPKIRRTVTGYPLRYDLKGWTRQSARQTLQLEGDEPILLVMGGSRGARSINQALFAALPHLLEQIRILHVSGQQAWEEVESVRRSLPDALAKKYHPYPYLFTEMGAALAAADLVLSRAGASCLGEYPAFGIPAVLVPYPYAWRYQRVNADYLVRQGAAMLVRDEELVSKMVSTVLEILSDPSRRKGMAEAMQRLSKPDAARSIATLLVSMAGAGR